MLNNVGPAEMIIIGIVALFLFGNKKLSELARGLGESTKEFKKIKKDIGKEIDTD
ncbi:twin-arginine translocase TatA/TatE family subunit [Patescibacteria group bacterium]|nr:twin-arginine translocase TatA/TatE family subunit [Patescibacteria group bacterium]MBU0777313.1 twin-arginine translocase TatA/TatE family subunit [Patescibacteria group bacterium]MBU0846107.1 twin-arginine translocase TatA/TatE family subunit [Patescibacteria group bacterium]MBU0923160.1 twin-arginine translocase TatA/TatE family subunit [Patescibacteria group bacterium]MBU1066875.1 twin-arginine translocase TatA/TatE family subunit [Patescibacteria group bacterium]